MWVFFFPVKLPGPKSAVSSAVHWRRNWNLAVGERRWRYGGCDTEQIENKSKHWMVCSKKVQHQWRCHKHVQMLAVLSCPMLLWGDNLTLMAEVAVFKTCSRHPWCPKEPSLMDSLNYKWGLSTSTYTIIFMMIPKSNFVPLTLSVVNDLSRKIKHLTRRKRGRKASVASWYFSKQTV